MIELLLAAERMLAAGDLDHAERLFSQVAEADPRNAIAVVGLAEVAGARGDAVAALGQARRALGIDPENAAARRMVERLEMAAPRAVAPEPEGAPEPRTAGGPEPEPPAPARRSWLDRILGFFGRR
ncbi:MAG: hypothetical protein EPO36_07540 [Chloroflexota bacterium]|nr:MAG: hypothetical protein EPO36_07540 [Chloroflexota bacterium]